jgi:hypothetical protein
MRTASVLVACIVAFVARVVAQPVPAGLQPGDHYHLIFATSFQTDIDTDTSVPPATPFFGGLAAADYAVTYTAWAAGMLPDWNFADLAWHAVLSTNGHNAKDRISVQGPIYNTHGDLIANDANDLWDGSIANPVGYDEIGQLITSDFGVWTGTKPDGTWSPS